MHAPGRDKSERTRRAFPFLHSTPRNKRNPGKSSGAVPRRTDVGDPVASVVSHKWLVLGCSKNAPGQGVRTEPTRSGL